MAAINEDPHAPVVDPYLVKPGIGSVDIQIAIPIEISDGDGAGSDKTDGLAAIDEGSNIADLNTALIDPDTMPHRFCMPRIKITVVIQICQLNIVDARIAQSVAATDESLAAISVLAIDEGIRIVIDTVVTYFE